MSSSRLKSGLVALGLAVAVALSGCSGLRPVYGDAGIGAERLALNFAKPGGRLEQIITQDLIVRLGSTADAGAPKFSVNTSVAVRQMTHTNTTKPFTNREVMVTARYSVTTGGEVVTQGSRQASANFTTNGQVLADEAAQKDATERAAHAVAETIRLSILGALSQPATAARAVQ
ncbi:MAG TPA: hypothetical protein PK286_05235 [Devosia sp.]|nr:hypothetical protein [Devosia sp.]